LTDKREAILQAALELFAERGFHGTPVPMIVEKANVGTGTMYRYFRDKEELVNVLYRHWKQELVKATIEDLPEDLPLRKLFHEIWHRGVNFALEHSAAYSFLEAHHHSPYLDEESYALTNKLLQRYIGFFERGCGEQIVKDVAPEVLMAVVGGILTELMKKHWGGWFELTPQLIEQAEEICWQAIRR
jgi:TetR/AcrR family transcriptional regulator, repressor of fatR-cypB operon